MDGAAYLNSNGWTTRAEVRLPARAAVALPYDDLPLEAATKRYLAAMYGSIYQHQHLALVHSLAAENVCLSTSTASGKSLVFYATALEHLQANPKARVIALYPLKALGREQEDRWRDALQTAGLDEQVGRIDGSVAVGSREAILRRCRVVTMTPDVVHAWLLSSLGNPTVSWFLKALKLIIVDEVHNYSGVFGSNSAMMFRRLRHVMRLLRSEHRWVFASATIADPAAHIRALVGVECAIVGPNTDGSPKHEVTLRMVEPPGASDLLSEVSRFLQHLARQTPDRFIAFVDSRKQTEQLASILGRAPEVEEELDPEALELRELESLQVLPYRAGYEERDQEAIQRALSSSRLKGVVSTSALELGMDIRGLDAGVLVGVPRSATSLLQRIGRIGRHAPGTVYIINTGTLYDQEAFTAPDAILERPLEPSALYLENPRIQYIHALCLARLGGEHDQVAPAPNEDGFASPIEWPEGFLELCDRERRGDVPGDLQSMKAESGDDPNHVFPLRDVESQFKVELRRGSDRRSLGSLSYGQLLREAYPGAIHYYITKPFRVTRVLTVQRLVQVRPERRFTTRPVSLPTLLFPNLHPSSAFRIAANDDGLVVAECELQVRESVSGWRERRGPNEFAVSYPADPNTGVFFNLPRFTRSYFTTGVVVAHPALERAGVQTGVVAQFLYEAFLMNLPLDRQDVSFGADRVRARGAVIVEQSPFVSVFDQTYGSLRLSGRVLEGDLLGQTLERALSLASRWTEVEVERASVGVNPETELAIAAMVRSYGSGMPSWTGTSAAARAMSPEGIAIILSGSTGTNTLHRNEEFEVQGVFFHGLSGLSYRGRNFSNLGGALDVVPIDAVLPIPGVSQMGSYNLETGEITPEPDES